MADTRGQMGELDTDKFFSAIDAVDLAMCASVKDGAFDEESQKQYQRESARVEQIYIQALTEIAIQGFQSLSQSGLDFITLTLLITSTPVDAKENKRIEKIKKIIDAWKIEEKIHEANLGLMALQIDAQQIEGIVTPFTNQTNYLIYYIAMNILHMKEKIIIKNRVERWLSIAMQLHNEGNYLSAMTIYAALTLSSIDRLITKDVLNLSGKAKADLAHLKTYYDNEASAKEKLQAIMTSNSVSIPPTSYLAGKLGGSDAINMLDQHETNKLHLDDILKKIRDIKNVNIVDLKKIIEMLPDTSYLSSLKKSLNELSSKSDNATIIKIEGQIEHVRHKIDKHKADDRNTIISLNKQFYDKIYKPPHAVQYAFTEFLVAVIDDISQRKPKDIEDELYKTSLAIRGRESSNTPSPTSSLPSSATSSTTTTPHTSGHSPSVPASASKRLSSSSPLARLRSLSHSKLSTSPSASLSRSTGSEEAAAAATSTLRRPTGIKKSDVEIIRARGVVFQTLSGVKKSNSNYADVIDKLLDAISVSEQDKQLETVKALTLITDIKKSSSHELTALINAVEDLIIKRYSADAVQQFTDNIPNLLRPSSSYKM
jgi:hypothetical protein